MDITRSPEGRDSDNRPFSGPSSSGATGHCSTDNVVTPVTTTGKRKCRSADEDEHCNERKNSVACSSQETDAAVIDVTRKEDMEDNRPFLTVKIKRNRDARRPSDKNDTEIQRPPQKFAAYMKGVGHNITRGSTTSQGVQVGDPQLLRSSRHHRSTKGLRAVRLLHRETTRHTTRD